MRALAKCGPEQISHLHSADSAAASNHLPAAAGLFIVVWLGRIASDLSLSLSLSVSVTQWSHVCVLVVLSVVVAAATHVATLSTDAVSHTRHCLENKMWLGGCWTTRVAHMFDG